MRLRPVRDALMATGTVNVGLAVLITAVGVFVFGWHPGHVVAGTVTGTVLWAVSEYLFEVGHSVPDDDHLPEVPAGAELAPAFAHGLAWRLLIVPAVVGFAWLGDRWDVGTFVIPGIFAGFALANFVGAALVREWEQKNAGRVFSGRRDGKLVLFAD